LTTSSGAMWKAGPLSGRIRRIRQTNKCVNATYEILNYRHEEGAVNIPGS
jgi:hypothetical protein